MIIGIIGTIIGAAVTGAGLFYLNKEKNDPDSKKIYSVISALGALVLVGSLIKLFL